MSSDKTTQKFEWRLVEDDVFVEVLIPADEMNWHSLGRVASIKRRGNGEYVVAYHWPHSSGHKQGDSAFLKTVHGCKKWTERNLAKFWLCPDITNSVT